MKDLMRSKHAFVVVVAASAAALKRQPDVYDVAIVGGGPAGLAAALAAKRALGPDAHVAVFERAPALLEIGGQVGLINKAFDALDAVDPSGAASAAVERAGALRRKFRLPTQRGTGPRGRGDGAGPGCGRGAVGPAGGRRVGEGERGTGHSGRE